MIALVRNSVTKTQLDQLVQWIEGRGLHAHVSHGDDVTIVGLVGDTSRIDPFLLESMDIIERVQRVSEPFKLASRSFHPADTVVDCGHGVCVGGGSFNVIAGPGSVAGARLAQIASAVRASGATMLSGCAYPPHVSPHEYQGVDEHSLAQLLEVGHGLDMPVVSEVLDTRDVDLFVRAGVDVIKVGNHNDHNLSLLREVGKTQTPVLLMRGVASTIDELLMAAEHVMSEGNNKVMLCEGGIRTFDTHTHATFDVAAVAVLRRLTHLPIIACPSHAAGHARYVRPCAYAATAVGADGLEVEVHDDSRHALGGGAQALTAQQFDDLMGHAMPIRGVVSPCVDEV